MESRFNFQGLEVTTDAQVKDYTLIRGHFNTIECDLVDDQDAALGHKRRK